MAAPLEPLPDHLPPGDVLADTAGVPVDGIPGRSTLVLGHQWRVMYVFGGITMAAALRAIEVELERPDLRLVTADATFCAAVPAGPVAIQVEVLRQGRAGAQAEARLWRLSEDAAGGSVGAGAVGGLRGPAGADLVVTAVYGRDRDLDAVVRGMALPEDAGSPDSVPRRLPDPARPSPFDHIPYHRQTDFRMTVGQPPWEMDDGPREPRTVSWFRFLRPPILDDGTWDRAPVVDAVLRADGGGVGLPADTLHRGVARVRCGHRGAVPTRRRAGGHGHPERAPATLRRRLTHKPPFCVQLCTQETHNCAQKERVGG